MINPIIFINEPLNFQGKLKIYPPSVKEVVANPNFNIYYKILTTNQYDIKEEIGNKIPEGEKMPTPFEYLMLNVQYVNGFSELTRMAFQFFCKADITFLLEEKKIIIGNIEEIVQNETPIESFTFLSEDSFFDFQNAIRESVGDKKEDPLEQENPNEDPRIRRIKEKARERDKLKARRASKDGISLSVCLVAICCMGIGITPLNIGEMSYASIGALMKMMQDKEKYDIDIRSLLAGADSKKIKPKYWIRNTND